MQSVHSQAIIGDKDERNAGVWTDEGPVYAPRIVWVDSRWGDRTVVVALPVAYVVCMVSGVVPGAVVAEACPLNQREALRWLPGPRRLCPY